MPKVSAARKAAFKILLALEDGKAHSDELLRAPAVSALAPADRNLTTALVLGVLRWQLVLDRHIQPLLQKPNAKLDREVRIALRLGAFQMLKMDRVPTHAAIDESVELTKLAGHRFASGMVNAVLRKLAKVADSIRFSDLEAYPEWMVARWTRSFGAETADAICRHGQRQPSLAVRLTACESAEPKVTGPKMTASGAEEELRQNGIALEAGELLTQARRVLSGDVTATAASREGRVRIQDEGSQLVAELAGQGEKILDACAAPGGKTLLLAERNPSARIVANEASATRLAQLRQRLPEEIECRLGDAAALPEEGVFDLVLADVPCSGTGTLGRNPEIRHRLTAEDFARHAGRQRAILSSALRTLRPGGRLVYSTCSLEPEENQQVVAAVLGENAQARPVRLEERIEALRDQGILTQSGAEHLRVSLTPEGFLYLLPGTLHTDGFFVAMLEKAV